MIDWRSTNWILALILVFFTLVLFTVVILERLGGNEALFLIIGHAAAWVEIVVIFFFRKSPPKQVK